MELRRIEQFNDWWTSGKVRATLLKPYKRPLFHDYLLKGGFPEIVEEESEEKIKSSLITAS